MNKYRIASSRAVWWDYANTAAYFITICTKDRKKFLGEVKAGEMEESVIGRIAQNCLNELTEQFLFAKVDLHVIMPNHIHAIVMIDNGNKPNCINTEMKMSVETRFIASESANGGFAGNKNPMINNNLPRIVRWFKGRVSYEARKILPEFSWQSRYHDHIIRNANSYNKISNYITENPVRWQQDMFHNS